MERLALYREAVKLVPLRSLEDLYSTLEQSPHRSYFLLVLCVLVAGLFLCGLLCGRVSHRAHREMKNRQVLLVS